MDTPLITVLTPCYNGERYIDRYAESLLSQTYKNIQIVFVDDGSNDSSALCINRYRERFLNSGYDFIYLYKENGGVSSAIEYGLRYVKGDYLVWPDVDDYMTPDSIEKKLLFLIDNPEYGLVRTNLQSFDEITGRLLGDGLPFSEKLCKHEWLFEDYLNGVAAWYQPGCFMVRMEVFRRANPDGYIYNSGYGQNIQMLLPIMYYAKCGFLNEKLYMYSVHLDSLAHVEKGNYLVQKAHLKKMRNTFEMTIRHMNIKNELYYITLVEKWYYKELCSLAFDYENKEELREAYGELKKLCSPNMKICIKRYGSTRFLRLFNKIRRNILK